MKNFRWTAETTLYTLAFTLALLVRLLGLGSVPLSSYEAGWALQALDLARGALTDSSANPGYVAQTGFLFSLLVSSDFTARFIPALSGALLSLAPLFFRKHLGRTPALLLAFFLAFDPGLAAVSRTAGGAGMALPFLVLTLGAWINRKRVLTGIFMGLALLSGPSIWHGILIAAATWGLAALLEASGLIRPASVEFGTNGRPAFSLKELGVVGITLGMTVLAAGMLFFKYPAALAGIGDSMAAYASGWGVNSGIPALRLPAALLVYQPFALIVGLVEAVRAWIYRRPEDAAAQRLSLWFLAALLLAFIMPGRQVDDLAWVVVPLLGLAAGGLVRISQSRLQGQNLVIGWAMALLLPVISIFTWNFILSARNLTGSEAQQAQSMVIYILIGMAAMVIGAGALIAFGWNLKTAVTGAGWGLVLLLVPFWFATLWGSMGLSANPRQEMWGRAPRAGQIELLTATLQDISHWTTGMRTSLDVVVMPESPALRWALRDWPAVEYMSTLEPGSMPPAIISELGQQPPALEASYAGQDFVLETSPDWPGVLPPDFVSWLAFRSSAQLNTTAIVWVRSDLFRGADISSSFDITP